MASFISAKEKAALAAVSPGLAQYVDEAGPTWNARLPALRKVTATLAAEVEALSLLAQVGLLRAETADLIALRTKFDAHRAQMELIAGENDDLRRRLQQATALPAMVVHGE
jgi:short-subunit dehydrogenase involved in D-alanine esterification of teichoic acids